MLRSIGHMFISQGPLGSLQAEILCWVSSVTFIGWEISFVSSTPPIFSQILTLGVQKKDPLGCVHNMCLSARISAPWTRFRPQHRLHLSLSPPCHFNFLQTSFTCEPWRTDISSFPPPFPYLSVTPVIHVCQPASCPPPPQLSSSLFYFAETQVALEEVIIQQNHLELSWEQLRVINFPLELSRSLCRYGIKWLTIQ